MYIGIYIYIYIYIYVSVKGKVYMYVCFLSWSKNEHILAIFYPFSQFCEIGVSLLSLQNQPKTAPNLFQRGVEYGKYVLGSSRIYIYIYIERERERDLFVYAIYMELLICEYGTTRGSACPPAPRGSRAAC